MGRPKKIKEAEKKVADRAEEISICPTALSYTENTAIAPLTQDFGREDINTIRDKINEIINNR